MCVPICMCEPFSSPNVYYLITTMYSEQDCIDALKSVASGVDGVLSGPRYDELRDELQPSSGTMKQKFGSWNEAKEEAELETYDPGWMCMRKSVNSQFFDSLDQCSAYWLGVLFGDGFVSRRDGGVDQIGLELTSDPEHVERFADDIGSNHNAQSGRIYIADEHMLETLASYGFDHQKTRNGSVPDLDESLRQPFARGLLDADGSVGERKISIAGHRPRIRAVGEWLPVEYKMYEQTYDQYDPTYVLQIGVCEDVRSVVRWMWPDGAETEPALPRKRQKAMNRWWDYEPR